MPKEFKTVDGLIELLESRGIETDGNTRMAIMRESYYAIVNGYKDPFLDREAMKSSDDDVYISGTKFKYIYDLFKFDRDLRFVTFAFIARAEAVMRTAVSHSFSQGHPGGGSYLDEASFCNPSEYLVPRSFKGDVELAWRKNLGKLIDDVLDRKLHAGANVMRPFVRHYLEVHGSVPLWVLSNDLTFGNVMHFYQLMQPADRSRTCKMVAEVSGRDSNLDGFLSPRDLLRAGTILKEFRNICAHDERLYCAKVKGAGFGDMVDLMRLILPKRDVEAFLDDIATLFTDYYEKEILGDGGENTIPASAMVEFINELHIIR